MELLNPTPEIWVDTKIVLLSNSLHGHMRIGSNRWDALGPSLQSRFLLLGVHTGTSKVCKSIAFLAIEMVWGNDFTCFGGRGSWVPGCCKDPCRTCFKLWVAAAEFRLSYHSPDTIL